MLSLLDGAPLPQRRPLLLLAAVHFLLLSGSEHPLAAFYDTVAPVRGSPAGPPPPDDVAAAFADFCHVHRGRARAAGRHPLDPDQRGRALHRPAARPLPHRGRGYGWHEPLSLLDLGTSAGLNLLFDDYAYTYRAAERRRRPHRRGARARPSPSSAPCGTT